MTLWMMVCLSVTYGTVLVAAILYKVWLSVQRAIARSLFCPGETYTDGLIS